MLPNSCQVLIVGTGPTGLTLACELLKFNVDFVIVDKLLQPQLHLAKGAAIGTRTREIFEDIDSSLISGIQKTGEDADSFEIRGGAELSLDGPYEVDTIHPGIICNGQYDTERVLRDYLISRGVTIYRGAQVCKLNDNGSFVEVEYTFDDGKVHSIKALYVAACDGAKSSIRKQLDIPYEGVSQPYTSVVALFSCTPPIDLSSSTGGKKLLQGFAKSASAPYFVLPMKGNRFGFMTNLHTDHEKTLVSGLDSHSLPIPNPVTKQDIQDIFDARSLPHKIDEIYWTSHFRVNNRLAKSYSKGRVFLAGDSCHSSDPFLGLGQNVGVQDAHNLGWKLGLVLQGKVKPEILETYDLERRADGKALMAQCKGNDGLMYMNGLLRGIFIYIIRNYLYFLADFSIKQASKVNFQYPKSDITVEGKIDPLKWLSTLWWYKKIFGWKWAEHAYSHQVSVGQRIPPHLLKTELYLGKSKYGFKAVVFSRDSAVQKKVAKHISDDFELVSQVYVADESLFARCGVQNECVMIVRPDGHVGFRSDDCNLDLAAKYFAGFETAQVKCNL